MEIWKDIPGYEGLYQASNLGRIKSLYFGKEKILKPLKHSIGYLSINLYINGIGKTHTIHSLIILSFVFNKNKELEINHINGIKTDNRLKNLELITHSKNQLHSYRVLGRVHNFKGKFGKDNPTSKKVNQYDLEGNFIKTFDCIKDIERQLGFCSSGIINCCKGIYKTSNKFIWKYL